MSSLSDKVKKFCSRYSINVLSENKRATIRSTLGNYFLNETDKDHGMYMPEYRSEAVITIDIPISKLESLVENETLFYNNFEDPERRHIFQRWMDQQEEEKRLRRTYASVQKAYEDYSALLTWCSQNPGKEFKIDLTSSPK